MKSFLLYFLLLLPGFFLGQFTQEELSTIDSLAAKYRGQEEILTDSSNLISVQLSNLLHLSSLEGGDFLKEGLSRPADSLLKTYFTFALLVSEKHDANQVNEALGVVKTNELLYGYFKYLISPLFNRHWKRGEFQGKYIESDSLAFHSKEEQTMMQFAITEGMKGLLRDKFENRGFDYIYSLYTKLPKLDSMNIILFKIESTKMGSYALLGSLPIVGSNIDRTLPVYQDIIGAFINKSKVNDTYYLYGHSFLNQKELFKLSQNKEELKSLYERFGEG